MSSKKPLPSISRKAPNARRDLPLDESDPADAKTIQDFFPTGDVDERMSDAVAKKRAKPVEAADDGFVMDFDFGTPTPVKRR